MTAQIESPTPAPLGVPDDLEVTQVAEILEAEGVTTSVPSPTLSDWLGSVAAHLRDWMETMIPMGGGLATVIGNVLLWTVVGAGALAFALLVVALLRSLRRQARQPNEIAEDVTATQSPMAAVKRPADWRATIDSCLHHDDARGAIEALWWYLIVTLGSEAGAAGRTGRDLLQKLGRHDLRPLLLRMEHATYGPLSPRIERVRELVAAVDEALAQADDSARAATGAS